MKSRWVAVALNPVMRITLLRQMVDPPQFAWSAWGSALRSALQGPVRACGVSFAGMGVLPIGDGVDGRFLAAGGV